MRFSAVFDPPFAMRAAPARDRAPVAAPADHVPAAPTAAAAREPLPDDLDQRVRLVGEWQLEDW